MHTIGTSCHTAHLDLLAGNGLLVLPDPATDVWFAGEIEGLHAADWNAIMRQLNRQGWTIALDDDGQHVSCGVLPDGREVLGLYGRDRVHDRLDIAEEAASWAALAEAVGMAA